MTQVLVTDSTTEGLRPLGTAPQRSYELITGTILGAPDLGARHAALFAEPVANAFGDRFDWYTEVPGPFQRLPDLPAAEATEVRAELSVLLADIRRVAETRKASLKGEDLRLGTALENALEVPDEASVFATRLPGGGWQPVLVNWAWVMDSTAEVRGVLAAADTKALPVVPSPPPMVFVPPEQASAALASGGSELRWLVWLGWLLLALMIGAILYLMIGACALRIPGLPGHCPVQAATAEPVLRQTRVLQDQIAAVARQLASADRACQPTGLPPIPDPVADLPATLAPVARDPENQARLRDQGAEMGQLAFSLLWDSRADLDLAVSCPGNATVYFQQRAICGGALDVDSNRDAPSARPDPVENIFFAAPGAGDYRVRVTYYGANGTAGPQNFTLRIQDRGVVSMYTGSVGPGQPSWTTTFAYGGQ